MAESPHLFAPLELRGVTARNRITISPMQQFMAKDGFLSEWHRVHLGQFAMGGAAIVFTEAMAVSADGRISRMVSYSTPPNDMATGCSSPPTRTLNTSSIWQVGT